MGIKTLITRFILIILCLAFTGGIIYLLTTIEGEKVQLQEEVRKEALSKQGLQSVATFLEQSNAELEKKVKSSERRIKELTLAIDEEKGRSSEFTQKISDKEAEIRRIRALIKNYEKEKKKMMKTMKLLNAAFTEIKLEYDDMAGAKAEAEVELEELDRIIKDLSKTDSTSLGTVVIR
jgi:chromosome segregation ATPase